MTDPRTQLVGRGYDKIGDRFTEWRDRIVGDPRREWEEELVSRLQDGARGSNSAAVQACRTPSASPNAFR